MHDKKDITEHETSKEVFKLKISQRNNDTAFSTNLKKEIDSSNKLTISSKVIQDERTRLSEIRKKIRD